MIFFIGIVLTNASSHEDTSRKNRSFWLKVQNFKVTLGGKNEDR